MMPHRPRPICMETGMETLVHGFGCVCRRPAQVPVPDTFPVQHPRVELSKQAIFLVAISWCYHILRFFSGLVTRNVGFLSVSTAFIGRPLDKCPLNAKGDDRVHFSVPFHELVLRLGSC